MLNFVFETQRKIEKKDRKLASKAFFFSAKGFACGLVETKKLCLSHFDSDVHGICKNVLYEMGPRGSKNGNTKLIG